MSTALATLTSQLATRFDLGDGAELIETLKATAFKGSNATNEQMTALLIVANQYGLNPWTKEIFAFPDKGGITPVVGVDGWSRIINSNDQFDGMEFEQDDESCTCIIYRKDRSRPIKITEYMDECKKPGTSGPWVSHPKRMLRHKAMIQCARIAFGFGGIYDEDEAERIPSMKDVTPQAASEPTPLPEYPMEEFEKNFDDWKNIIESGKRTADDIIAKVKSRYTLTDLQETSIRACSGEQGAVYENT